MDIQKYIKTEHPGYTFEDICGRDFWKKILGSYHQAADADEALGLSNCQCLLLYGPFASGKSTLLSVQAGEMVSAGYQYLSVNLKKVPKEMVSQVFRYILDEFLPQKPCYLYLEHIEALKDGELLWSMVEEAAEHEDYYLIVGAAAEDVEQVDPFVRKFFMAYYVNLPDASDREAYLKEYLEDNFEHASVKSMRLLVEQTEGYNYLQLEALASQIKFRIKYQILTKETTVESATNMLRPELLEEVLAMKKPVLKKETGGSGINSEELAAILQTIAAAQPAREKETPKENVPVDPVQQLREKYAPKKVFNQGVYLTKDRKTDTQK